MVGYAAGLAMSKAVGLALRAQSQVRCQHLSWAEEIAEAIPQGVVENLADLTYLSQRRIEELESLHIHVDDPFQRLFKDCSQCRDVLAQVLQRRVGETIGKRLGL